MRKITATCSSLVEFLENVIVVNFVIISHLEKGGFVAGINTGYCFMEKNFTSRVRKNVLDDQCLLI